MPGREAGKAKPLKQAKKAEKVITVAGHAIPVGGGGGRVEARRELVAAHGA
jgi:hypothetical protein